MSNYKYVFNLHNLFAQDFQEQNILKLFSLYNDKDFKFLKHSIKYNNKNIYDILENYNIVFDENTIYVFNKEFDIKKVVLYKKRFVEFCKYRKYKVFPEINIQNTETERNEYFLYTHFMDWFKINHNVNINYSNTDNLKKVQESLREYKDIKAVPNYPGESGWIKDFWIFRGWSEEEAEKRVHQLQSANSLTFLKKRHDHPEITKEIQHKHHIGLNKGILKKKQSNWKKKDNEHLH